MRCEIVESAPKQVWVSFDGIRFDSAAECELYEAAFVQGIPHVIRNQEALFDGSPFCLYVFFKIENELQLKDFEAWCDSKYYESDASSIDFRRFLGKIVVVDCRNEADDGLVGITDIYALETLEENIGRYAETMFKATAGLR